MIRKNDNSNLPKEEIFKEAFINIPLSERLDTFDNLWSHGENDSAAICVGDIIVFGLNQFQRETIFDFIRGMINKAS